MKPTMKKLVAGIALAGALTVGGAGAASAADSGSGAPDATAPTGQGARHPALRLRVRRAAVKIVTGTLGVSRQDLVAAVRGGQTISQYATSLGKDPQAVADALVKAADAKLDQLVTNGRLTQARADTMKGKVPDLVNRLLNRQFGARGTV
jgi:uncharacterized protein YidB (DUF937 family)